MDPQSQLYTRQQIAELTGIEGSALNYWSREGLLVPKTGGSGSGSHRRFDFVQVNIAAIFGELRRFGINIAALRSLAQILQAAASIGSAGDLHPVNYELAARIATKLDRFRSGDKVLISALPSNEDAPAGLSHEALAGWLTAKRSAETAVEIVQSAIPATIDFDPPERILAAAKKMLPGSEMLARVYADLVFGILAPGFAGANGWLLALGDDDTWRIAFGEGAGFFGADGEDLEDFGTGLFLPVESVIRKIWNLESPEDHRRERRTRASADGAGSDT